MSKRKPIPFDQLTKPPKPEYYAAYSGRDVWGMGHYGIEAYNEAVRNIDMYYIGPPAGGPRQKGKKVKKGLKVVKITKRIFDYIENHSGYREADRVRRK